MRQSTITLALCLCTFLLACKRPDPIRLQPTIEEPPTLLATIRMSDPSTTTQLLRGFYELERTWRWAGPRFTVALQAPPGAAEHGARLVLDFTVPETSLETLKTLTLRGKVGDAPLDPQTVTSAGDHEYRRDVPASAFVRPVMDADFNVDKFLQPQNDGRQLSVIVTSIGLESR